MIRTNPERQSIPYKPAIFLCLLTASLFGLVQNFSLYQSAEKYHQDFKALQDALRESRKNRAQATALAKSNRAGLDNLSKLSIPLRNLPEFIRDLDRKMAAHSLFREDVAYRKKETAGSFVLVQITLRLTGNYEEFRRFLSEVENQPDLVWFRSVQSSQDKTFLRFTVGMDVLMTME